MPALRWGVIGTGIGASFIQSLHAHTPQRVTAVAARDPEKTSATASRLGVERWYTDASALIEDPAVDVVYVATPHPLHTEVALEAISAGKPVLIEKPIAMTSKETDAILAAGRAAGVLVMEAMWTRYLPQTDVLRQVLDDGLIGDVRLVTAAFAPLVPYRPEHRLWNPALGGGALLDAGIYPIALSSMVLGTPAAALATGAITPAGVDAWANLLVTAEGGGTALLSTSLVTSFPARAAIGGSRGRVEFAPPFFAPGRIEVTIGPWGQQETAAWTHPATDKWTDGYAFEATAFASYVGDSRVESPLHTHEETSSIIRTIEDARSQIVASGSTFHPVSSIF